MKELSSEDIPHIYANLYREGTARIARARGQRLVQKQRATSGKFGPCWEWEEQS